MLTRQFRYVLLAQDLVARKTPFGEISSRLGIKQAWAVERTVRQARSYNFPALKEIYRKLLETDVAIKRGQEGGVALDLLVADLCSVGGLSLQKSS